MKKVIKPSEDEEAVYYSDFTGKPLNDCGPEAKLILDFSYGSKYDGSSFILHLSDEDAEEILSFLSFKLSDDCKKEIKKNLEQFNVRYEDSMEFREWENCDYLNSNREVFKRLLDLKKD